MVPLLTPLASPQVFAKVRNGLKIKLRLLIIPSKPDVGPCGSVSGLDVFTEFEASARSGHTLFGRAGGGIGCPKIRQ